MSGTSYTRRASFVDAQSSSQAIPVASKAARVFKPLPLILLLIVLGLCATLVVFAGTRSTIKHWDITCPPRIDAQLLSLRLDVAYGEQSFFSISQSAIKAALLAEPLIRSAEVSKVFPDTVLIRIQGRSAVVAALCEIDGRARAALVDSEGVLFAIAELDDEVNLPVLSGLRIEDPRPGTRLPNILLPLLASIASIQETDAPMLNMVSEFRYVKKSAEGGECLIYSIMSNVPIRVSTSVSAENLKSAALILDVMEKRGLAATVREVDLRSGTIVYKNKEGGA